MKSIGVNSNSVKTHSTYTESAISNLPVSNIRLSRRTFLAVGAYSGGMLLAVPGTVLANNSEATTDDNTLTPLMQISADNHITFYYPSPEMGQGVDTSLAMLFMEELGGDMNTLSVAPLPYLIEKDADGNVTFTAVPQGAGGSTSIPRNWPLLRKAGAIARQLFCQAAAKVMQVPVESLYTQKSRVYSQNGQSLTFAELADIAAKEGLPDGFEPQLKPRKAFDIIGTKQQSRQLKSIVTGQPLYGMDMDYPGAKVALMVRSPWFDGEVAALDNSKAKALSGVIDVVLLPRPDPDKYYTYLAAGVAVIAEDFWTAKKARDLLDIQWTKGPTPDASTDALYQQCHKLLEGKGQVVRDDGDYDTAMASADKVFRKTYQLPLVSHAQMEPQNCIAHVTEDNCTIIGPMQSPGGASRLAEVITGFDRVNMDIRYTRLGGGFGRRLTSDHVAEAVTISKLSKLPVKLIWTREDDLSHDFYRPMGVHQLSAGVDDTGNVTAWRHRLAGTPKHYRRNGRKPDELYSADMYVDDFPAALVDNLRLEYLLASSPFPQGSWRAPAHTANAFVVQSFLNELAEELGKDKLQLRLDMLGQPKGLKYEQHGGPEFHTGRMANVLKEATRMAGWGRKMPANVGLGLAGHFTFGGYCAQVVEAELIPARVDSTGQLPQQVKVHNVWCAIDVGTVVNPDGVKAQVEGGINDGLSSAMGQEIIVQNGKVSSVNFDTYAMAFIADSVTNIETHIVASEATPAGAGEMTLPPFSPALADSIVAAGGKRIRQHPMAKHVQKA